MMAASSVPYPLLQQQQQPGVYQQQAVPQQQQAYTLQQQQQQQERSAPPSQPAAKAPSSASSQRPVPGPAQRRNSGGGQAPKKTRDNSKSTPTPTLADTRLSGAHRASLVGPRIQDLVAEIDPNYTIDAQAEEQVLRLADDFLENVCKMSLKLAQHRGSKVLDIQDVQLVLQKHYSISIPGLPPLPKPSVKAVASRSASGGGGGGVKRKSSAGNTNTTNNNSEGAPAAKWAKTGSGDVKSSGVEARSS
jgi:transcription initiation factor TFIID subunit 12